MDSNNLIVCFVDSVDVRKVGDPTKDKRDTYVQQN